MGFLDKKKSLAELEEEEEYLQAEYSVEQKRAMIREVRARGGDPNAIGSDGRGKGLNFQKIWQWLKTH